MTNTGQTTTIFIIEDHWLIKQEYTALIKREPDLEICGEAATAAEALEKIPQLNPAIIITDISLKDMNGVELIAQLHQQCPALLTLVISGHDEALYAKKAYQAGAKGYLVKTEAWQVVKAIRHIMQGDLYFSAEIQRGFTD